MTHLYVWTSCSTNMSHISNAEISVRHLPNVSDTSITFQIPSDGHFEERLMDEDSKAFLLGFDDSLETPIPPTRCSAQDPLTLDQLTPQRKLTSDIQDALTSTFAPPDVSNAVSPKLPTSPLRIGGRAHTKARPTRSKLTNSHITPDAWSTSRFGDLELEVDSLLRRNSGADSIRGAPTRPGERRPDETRTEPPEGHRLHSEERASELQDVGIHLRLSLVVLTSPSVSHGHRAH